MLNNIKTKERGFTIVELLIVIVVIAILAAISIVAYNGIQQKANTTSAQNAANAVMKKIEAANAANNGYPASTVTTVTAYTAVLNGDTSSKLENGLSIVAAPDATTGKTAVKVANCGGVGAKVYYYDFGTKALTANPYKAGDTSGTCTDLT